MTIECDRDDCAIEHSPMVSTLIAWSPLYDKNGFKINNDPNSYSTTKTCLTCNRKWNSVATAFFGGKETDTEITDA